MKSLITLFAFLALTLNAAAQPPDTLWTRTFGGNDWDVGLSVQQTLDGGYIILGYTESYGSGNSDVYLIKTDSNGNQIWQRTFGGSNDEDAESVQQTADGGYIITGSTKSYGSGDYDVYLIKTDANGNETWHRTFGGSDADFGSSVQHTSDGGYIIAGSTWSFGAGGSDVYLIKTNADGDLVWTRTFGGSNNDIGQCVQQTLDGGYVITGYTQSYGIGADLYLVKTDSEGYQIWQRTFGGSGGDYGQSVLQTSDGGYIIVGFMDPYGSAYSDVYLIKTNADGDSVWTRTFGDIGWDVGSSIQQITDGGYVIAGWTGSYGAGNLDVYLIKTDAEGNQIWQRTFGGSGSDWGNSVLQTADGGYAIAGRTNSYGEGSYDVYLIKTDAGGTPVEPWGEPTPSPAQFALLGAFPNPFNPSTTIRFELPQAAQVRLEVFDVNGRAVGAHGIRPSGGGGSAGASLAPLQEVWYPAGSHEIVFSGSDLPSGVYLYRLTATPSGSGTSQTMISGKMVLLK
ncbi:MAG: hypothetical protein NTW14_03925 [bacterium]|nr:hypothetical protein [bacterium]